MKQILVLVFITLLYGRSSAQQQSVEQALKSRMNADEPGLSAAEARKHIGEHVYVVDKVLAYKLVNRKIAILYLGSKQQKRALVIILKKENDVLTDTQNWIGHTLHFSGKVELYEHRPAIVVTNNGQLGTRIQI